MGKTNAQKKIKFYGPENAGPDNFIYGQGSKSRGRLMYDDTLSNSLARILCFKLLNSSRLSFIWCACRECAMFGFIFMDLSAEMIYAVL